MKWQGDEYEVIILGTGLGGLIAGAYLSREHHPVLLLRENQYRSSYKEKGYRFIPFSNFSEKRMKGPLLKRISEDLDIASFISHPMETRRDETKLMKPKERVSFQVILPKSRIDLFYQRSVLRMELEREFPKEIARIESFYTEMEKLQPLLGMEMAKEKPGSFFPVQPRSLIQRWWPFNLFSEGSIDQRLAPFSGEFREFIKWQWISWGSLLSDQFPISLANYLLSHDGTDEWEWEIDLEILKENILRKFLQSGGKVEEIERVDRVDRKWRKGFTLFLEGSERTFQSRFLILNSPLHRLSGVLGKNGRLLSKWGERIHPRYALIPLFLGVREKVIPVGMRNLLVSILDPNKPYEGGNLLFLSLSQKGDETEAPDERRALTVESLMIPEKWDSDSFAEHQKGVMRHLYYLIPFLEDYVEFADWDWASHHYPCWSYPHFFYETCSHFRWREGVVPNRISKGFYFVGKENFPYLGMEGEVLNGLMAARDILENYS